MDGYLSLILHAHLPFVRHPEHDRFLEENWLFEAMTETYLPLLEVMRSWQRDGMATRLCLTLSPTLCAMFRDPLLQQRFVRHLHGLVELSERETFRTQWEPALRPLAAMYHERFRRLRALYESVQGDLIRAFRALQEAGQLEIITCAATHAVLPLLAPDRAAMRAQILVARDDYRDCFGREPRGIWLPECAYVEGLDSLLAEAGLRWFVVDTHGIQFAQPRPPAGLMAPLRTPSGVAAFGRDDESARQVWSRREGYPGDPRYRDFYRDIGFDLDLSYLQPFLAADGVRSFTGIKYHAISSTTEKRAYDRAAALGAAGEHARHFLQARTVQLQAAQRHHAETPAPPPIIVCPYDAELFGHWWYEGPEFLDYFVRQTVFDQKSVELVTPTDYLDRHGAEVAGTPAASSWGEDGYLKTWLNETNEWILPHLQVAQERMKTLVGQTPANDPLLSRALRQAGRELLLAQSSDWPFILRSGTSPDYARRRVRDHLLRFITLHEQLTVANVNEKWLEEVEAMDNLFPRLNPEHWQVRSTDEA